MVIKLQCTTVYGFIAICTCGIEIKNLKGWVIGVTFWHKPYPDYQFDYETFVNLTHHNCVLLIVILQLASIAKF